MSGNIRDIKDRIDSVKKTEKITLAMKMVAAAKFKRNVTQLDHIKEYGDGIGLIISSLSKRLYLDDQIPDLLKKNSSNQTALIIISSDRGLCGGFNANLFKEVRAQLEKNNIVDLYIIGNKAYQMFKSKDVKIVDHVPTFSGENSEAEMANYINSIINSYKDGVYSKVSIVYNEFVSALSSNQITQQLLPIELPDWNPDVISRSDFIYESSKRSSLDTLLTKYINYLFKRATYESLASEEGSRMAAMDSASSNANEMIDELTLFFNRSRQAAITTELTEIIAGAASLS